MRPGEGLGGHYFRASRTCNSAAASLYSPRRLLLGAGPARPAPCQLSCHVLGRVRGLAAVPPQPATGLNTCEEKLVKTILRWGFILSAVLWGALPAHSDQGNAKALNHASSTGNAPIVIRRLQCYQHKIASGFSERKR